ncbi:MAG: hypothetical protein HQK87_10300, partial [Nitrospinae bacterium]|nr:hypothetical protein [Nitrospinota bacterium]
GKINASIDPVRSSSVSRAIGSPFFVVRFRFAVTMPPIRTSPWGGASPMVEGDELLFIKGKADVDEENLTVTVIADEVLTFAQARSKFTSSVHVHVTTTGLERETLEEMRAIFTRRRGKAPVTLHLKSPRGTVVMRASSYAVDASEELIADVEKLLGEETVTLE